MSTKKDYIVNPYVFFGGKAEEAVEFYRTALGAEVIIMMRYKDAPKCDPPAGAPAMQFPPNWESKIMHGTIKIGNSFILLSDGCGEKHGMDGFSLSLTTASPAEAEGAFAALAKGGKVTMPLGKTFFSPAFGMVEDKFGLGWMVYVEGQKPS